MIVGPGKHAVIVSGGVRSIKMQLARSVVRDSATFDPEALIEKTPGVCGGAARIVRTRVPVWVLERYRQLGASARDLLEQFPSLRETDIRAAFYYAARHQRELAEEIAANESA